MNKTYTDEDVDQIVKRRLERARKVHKAEIYKAKAEMEKSTAEKYSSRVEKLEIDNSKQMDEISYYKTLDEARSLLERNNSMLGDRLLKELYSLFCSTFSHSEKE